MSTLVLTADQQSAMESFHQFLLDPVETVFVLSGYSGTGKSTLVGHLLDSLPGFMKMAKLIQADIPEYEVQLTATTNKAAENLSFISGMQVQTIHSFLGLRVSTDYKTGVTTLKRSTHERKRGFLLFIDEASYIDRDLLQLIFQMTEHCKIVFMGDPAQLTPVKSSSTPVFDAGFKGATLTQVVRQADGNPIVELSTRFRETVNTGEFFSFTPDGQHVQYLPREAFNKAIEEEFTRPDWRYQDSKILAWTNKTVVAYNHAIRDHVLGDPKLQVGDYAICNSFVTQSRRAIKTDQLVCITGISEEIEQHDVRGHLYTLDNAISFFGASSLVDRQKRLKAARANNEWYVVAEIEGAWIDLRAAYACTINKAQGSTFNKVFIDLDDIRRCNSGDQIARMLYVGVSRARHQVILTGDLV